MYARPPCPSPTPGVYPNPCPSSRWCHPAISSSVVPFSSCPQSFPASGSFQMSQFFTSGGQSTGVLASASVLPMNTQDWSPLGWTGCISLQSKGLSRVLSNMTAQSINSSALSFLHSPTLTSIHDHWKNHSLDQMDLSCCDSWGRRVGHDRGTEWTELMRLLPVHAQSCPTLRGPIDCSPLGCSVHGIFQTRILGLDCHALLQGIFTTQGSNTSLLCLLHW